MGVSTNAYLSFGFDLDESLEYTPDGEEDELSEHEAEEALGPILSKYNLKILSHCHRDYPMFIVCYAPTESMAWRGYPQELDLDSLKGLEHKGKEAFHLFISENPKIAEQIGLTDEAAPAWLLCSDWG